MAKEIESLQERLEPEGKSGGSAEPKVDKTPHNPNYVLKEHLEEIRALRKRLEESINVNDRLREQLEAQFPGADQGESEGAGHTNTNIHIPSLLTNGSAATAPVVGGGDKLYAICTQATYNAIHRSVSEGCVLAKLMETKLSTGRGDSMSTKKSLELLNNIKFLLSYLDECTHNLSLFWKSKVPQQNDDLVAKLKKRLIAQEKTMRQTLEKLTATNRKREVIMEQAIIDQKFVKMMEDNPTIIG